MKRICDRCGIEYDDDEVNCVGEMNLCFECAMEMEDNHEVVRCDSCGDLLSWDEIGKSDICPHCKEKLWD